MELCIYYLVLGAWFLCFFIWILEFGSWNFIWFLEFLHIPVHDLPTSINGSAYKGITFNISIAII